MIKSSQSDEKIYTWEEFKAEAARLRRLASPVSPILFRGQADAQWKLTTTLERSGHSESVADYYHLILRLKSEIGVATDRTWSDDTSVTQLEQMAREYDDFSLALVNLPHYAYMVYLRHHGFPTPLLDWSRSPFVAAYFAFRNDGDGDGNVAIYAFVDRTGSIKTSSSDEAQIQRLGPYVAGHTRHFSQQSEYTICLQYFENGWNFVPHSSVLDPYRDGGSQDILKKFTVRASERRKVLDELQDYNLNAYTLFGSEEALMEYLSNREDIAGDKADV